MQKFILPFIAQPKELKKTAQEFWIQTQRQTYWQTPQAPNSVEAREALTTCPPGWTACDYTSHNLHVAFYDNLKYTSIIDCSPFIVFKKLS